MDFISSISGKRGKWYISINCSNTTCGNKLLLKESPLIWTWEQRQAAQNDLRQYKVQCVLCKRETSLDQVAFLSTEIR